VLIEVLDYNKKSQCYRQRESERLLGTMGLKGKTQAPFVEVLRRLECGMGRRPLVWGRHHANLQSPVARKKQLQEDLGLPQVWKGPFAE
jgi:hypothetical protein